jgi:hypothetical protein
VAGAADQLLTSNRVQDVAPASEGAVEAAAQNQANHPHVGDPALDTTGFPGGTVGNLRLDYVLPSDGFDVLATDVFWPTGRDELARLVTTDPLASSDHRLVWADLI